MNEIIRSLYDRKSVRVFENRPISAECKKEILMSAMEAPTAGNQQLYTILDITDQKLKDKLAVSCDNQPFIAKAPLILIFCADVLKWFDVFKEGGSDPRKPGCGDLFLAVNDALIAAQNAVVAAESMGIGSCYIGDIMEQCKLHREMLHLPSYVFPAAMLVFGYPTDQQKNRKKPERCRLEDMVQENVYQRRDGQQLRKMFDKETKNRSFEEWSQAFCKRKYNSDFSKEMSRSVQEYLKDYQN
ncbi:MAG: nitroreductase [Lachnospiraceae bacterium]|nr:nitroreductase [Lachnospiraceae bacterium]